MTDLRTLRKSQREGWDREYAYESPLWRGPSEFGAPLGEDATVLELGCGDGKTVGGLLRPGRFVFAIDYSSRAIEACGKRFGCAPGLHLVMSDVCALPFYDESFDAIIAYHILEHLMSDYRTKTTIECRRVLRRSGRVFMRVFSVRDMRCGKGKEVERNTFVRGNSIACHYFSEDELRDLFVDFEEESLEERVIEKRYDGEDLQRVTIDAVFSRV
jgi:SAM-dependent methyltransferase